MQRSLFDPVPSEDDTRGDVPGEDDGADPSHSDPSNPAPATNLDRAGPGQGPPASASATDDPASADPAVDDPVVDNSVVGSRKAPRSPFDAAAQRQEQPSVRRSHPAGATPASLEVRWGQPGGHLSARGGDAFTLYARYDLYLYWDPDADRLIGAAFEEGALCLSAELSVRRTAGLALNELQDFVLYYLLGLRPFHEGATGQPVAGRPVTIYDPA